MRRLENRLIKFLMVGFVNTAVSYISFLALNLFFTYQIAYIISYGFGLITSYVLNGKWTFSSQLGYRGLALYPLAYLLQFISGYWTLKVGIESFQLAEFIAYAISLLVSIPIGFITTKYFFQWLHKNNDTI